MAWPATAASISRWSDSRSCAGPGGLLRGGPAAELRLVRGPDLVQEDPPAVLEPGDRGVEPGLLAAELPGLGPARSAAGVAPAGGPTPRPLRGAARSATGRSRPTPTSLASWAIRSVTPRSSSDRCRFSSRCCWRRSAEWPTWRHRAPPDLRTCLGANAGGEPGGGHGFLPAPRGRGHLGFGLLGPLGGGLRLAAGGLTLGVHRHQFLKPRQLALGRLQPAGRRTAGRELPVQLVAFLPVCWT